ncbi:MAG: immune inhibitor A [Bacillus sp. (in: Bacteria)]|nr:immune inhibitor A [Bacillus sp. (in: firmicutes)]
MFTNNRTDIHLGGGFLGVVATHLEAILGMLNGISRGRCSLLIRQGS